VAFWQTAIVRFRTSCGRPFPRFWPPFYWGLLLAMECEKRISTLEGTAASVARDVTDIKGKVDKFTNEFTEFLIKQARREGQEEALRSHGTP